MASILKSLGLKRLLASLVAMLLGVVASNPTLQPLLAPLTYIAGALGLVGITHAVVAGTVSSHPFTSIGAALSALLAAVSTLPQVQPYLPLISAIVALFGALGIGASAQKVITEKDTSAGLESKSFSA